LKTQPLFRSIFWSLYEEKRQGGLVYGLYSRWISFREPVYETATGIDRHTRKTIPSPLQRIDGDETYDWNHVYESKLFTYQTRQKKHIPNWRQKKQANLRLAKNALDLNSKQNQLREWRMETGDSTSGEWRVESGTESTDFLIWFLNLLSASDLGEWPVGTEKWELVASGKGES